MDKPTGIVTGKIAEPTPPRPIIPAGGNQVSQPQPVPPPHTASPLHPTHLEGSYNGDLFKEYQRQKQRLHETIQQKERERDELVRQLAAPPLSAQVINNRLQNER